MLELFVGCPLAPRTNNGLRSHRLTSALVRHTARRLAAVADEGAAPLSLREALHALPLWPQAAFVARFGGGHADDAFSASGDSDFRDYESHDAELEGRALALANAHEALSEVLDRPQPQLAALRLAHLELAVQRIGQWITIHTYGAP